VCREFLGDRASDSAAREPPPRPALGRDLLTAAWNVRVSSEREQVALLTAAAGLNSTDLREIQHARPEFPD